MGNKGSKAIGPRGQVVIEDIQTIQATMFQPIIPGLVTDGTTHSGALAPGNSPRSPTQPPSSPTESLGAEPVPSKGPTSSSNTHSRRSSTSPLPPLPTDWPPTAIPPPASPIHIRPGLAPPAIDDTTHNPAVPARPLTTTHYACYTSHRRMRRSHNVLAPVRCMVCAADEPFMHACVWCCMRICTLCARALRAADGDLERVVEGRGGLFGGGNRWSVLGNWVERGGAAGGALDGWLAS